MNSEKFSHNKTIKNAAAKVHKNFFTEATETWEKSKNHFKSLLNIKLMAHSTLE